MVQTKIVRIGKADWKMYRLMRLSALKDAPDAFGSLFEDQSGYEDAQSQRRVAGASQTNDFPAFALVDDEPVGMGWAVIESAELPVGHIYQMWVKPQHRGSGIGRLVLEHLLDWFKSRGVASVFLGVTCGNSPAKSLYESCGFLPVGNPEPLREGSELLAQEMMVTL